MAGREDGTQLDAEERGATATLARPDDPWVTIVWNDPVNLMSYVAYVFESYFGYTQAKAEQLMLEVHHEGRSAVSTGSREQMERDVQAMHERGLWATFERSPR
ncbi:ATP-dependent Clp protease adapter ClpS [Sanguibacter hominis ATCC BAA-789]|uniref:ATP-dependent Clp protease adapter protein ClpS n=1 Tax=Sanguibacter hominis ATCC BAA-789 TaxID=1312740 RepID=A0A9X5F9L4_9MICO|nr:ATP-dependent Clp protease adapter ClpS [Sanguibacter hominis ATCC BAA-789]